MRKLRDTPGLGVKTLDLIVACQCPRAYHLDGHLAIQRGLCRKIDHTHSSTTEHSLEYVIPKPAGQRALGVVERWKFR